MSTNVIQPSFAAGELSPTLFARVDLAKYHTGAARMLNFFVDYRGGASTRPGLELTARVYNSNFTVRLIPFQFSVVQNYILEFGNFYMRVLKNNGLVLEPAKTLTGVTNASPGVFTSTGHGFSNGDQVAFNVQGMTQLNVQEWFVANAAANTFELTDWNGQPVVTGGFGIFTSGTVSRVYRLATPYAADDLAMLKFTQSADVMTICHPDYAPRDLTRTADAAWTLNIISIGSTITPPTGLTATITPGTAGSTNYAYLVTALDANGQESVASSIITILNAVDIRSTAGSVKLTWNAVTGATGYIVYKALQATSNPVQTGALYGYMTSTTGNASVSAVDANIIPDFTTGPPTNNNPFGGGNNPATVTYDQQRKVYAGSDAQPETFWMSKPGQFSNFDTSSPIQPGDSIEGTLVSRQVNQIKHMVSMPNGLIMLTSGGAWQISGAGGVLSPTTVQATPQAYNGAGDVPPLTINYEIIYVQQKGTIVRDLSYSFYTNIYTGTDLSVLSNHLFTGFQLREWTYAEEPFKLIWAVRSDGSALCLTYLKEQEIFGWSRHETQGRFESVASIPEGPEDAVYFVVQRLINGQFIRFIERVHTRNMAYGPEDAFCVDCGLSTDLSTRAAVLTISGTTGTVTVLASAPVFSSGDVGSVIRAGGGIMTITSFSNANTVVANVTRPITDVDDFHTPVLVWPQVAGSWTISAPFTTISGLNHLEGELVSILADGNVNTPQVVTNGAVTIPHAATKATVGLAYTAQLQTLYLDVGEPTIQAKRKNIVALTARVDQARGLKMGPTFTDLTEFKDRDLDTIGQPIDLFTGDQRMIIGGGWNEQGQMCLQQDNPLPATILGVIPEITVGDDK